MSKKSWALNKFKDKYIYLIDIENIINHKSHVQKLSQELSDLAKIILRQAAILIEEKLTQEYGVPRTIIEKQSDWVLCALGKLGGSALGYASDIEIMFLYEDSGKTDGKKPIANHAYFESFCERNKQSNSCQERWYL